MEHLKVWSLNELQSLRNDFKSHTTGYYTLRNTVISKLEMAE